MSLEKAIDSGKEHRKSYRGAKAVDPTCRNHGSCSWCVEDRLAASERLEAEFADKIEEYERGEVNC